MAFFADPYIVEITGSCQYCNGERSFPRETIGSAHSRLTLYLDLWDDAPLHTEAQPVI
ncbi:protein of unknown function [Candidatus Filomicrobium marinum]|uniref:Uncharacterized protein n=1 Tax=Candidatus Filomicrobium marinum TaxID=1608628 RepID=A0A0D6JFW2_9HYPH|nr:protein of unknown function [Candidatus Filomicrobium marinum]